MKDKVLVPQVINQFHCVQEVKMLAIIFLPVVFGQVVKRSNLDQIGNSTCSSEHFLAAAKFPSGNLTCLAPENVIKNAKFTNVNVQKMVYFPDRHFKKFVLVKDAWVSTQFYTDRYGEYVEIAPHTGCLMIIKSIFSTYIFRTFGLDPYLVPIKTTQKVTTVHQSSSARTSKRSSTRANTRASEKFTPTTKSQTPSRKSVTTEKSKTSITKTKKSTTPPPTKQQSSTRKVTAITTSTEIKVLVGVLSFAFISVIIVLYIFIKRRNRRPFRVIGHIYENNVEPETAIEETNV